MSQQSLRQSVVSHQLDDLNALGDALAAAARDGDPERLATVLSTMERFVVAFEWGREAALPAIFSYVDSHSELPDDLFAPAYVLRTISPSHERTAALLAQLPQPVGDLLAVATPRCPPRP